MKYGGPGNQLCRAVPYARAMPEISISDDQRERLEGVRRDVEEAFVDTYGHARMEDAIEYLLDTYTPPDGTVTEDAYEQIATAAYPDLQRVASDVPEVPGSGLDADEMRGKLLAELGVEEFAARLDATSAAESGDESETEPGADGTKPDAGGDGADDAEDGADGAGDTGSDADGQPRERASGIGGSNPMAAVNQLLREHDDKWRESDGDAPYEVDLPDGTTESARTKDDVRQLLFRHY